MENRIGQYLWGRRSKGTESKGEPVSPDTTGAVVEKRSEVGAVGDEIAELPEVGTEFQEEIEEMDDERMQILKMVEEHKISAEEGAKLLAAMETGAAPAERTAGRQSRWLRIRVTDLVTGRNKVNVNVPLDVITAAGKLGVRFGLNKYAEREGIDLDQLFESIRNGAVGKLVDVADAEGGDHVEIYVE